MITINQFFTVTQAGRDCLKKVLEREEMNLPDYERPLKRIPKEKKRWSIAGCYGFASTCVKGILP